MIGQEMKNRLARSLFVALTLAVAAPAAAQVVDQPTAITPEAAKTMEQAQETIRLFLSDYHGVPARETLEQVTPEARDILLSMGQDDDLFSLHRHRALSALAQWPDDEVRSLIFGLLKSDETSEVLKHHLLGIAGNAFGAEAVEVIAPYLDHADVQLRLSAVSALGRIPHEDAEKVLRRAVSQENNTVVRERLEDALIRTR